MLEFDLIRLLLGTLDLKWEGWLGDIHWGRSSTPGRGDSICAVAVATVSMRGEQGV